jgi:DNA-binding beta-propeller fold protein YncE
MRHWVQVFSPSLDLLTVFGSLGRMPGELDTPLGIAVDSHGHVVVADCGNHRVQIFDLPHTSLRYRVKVEPD